MFDRPLLSRTTPKPTPMVRVAGPLDDARANARRNPRSLLIGGSLGAFVAYKASGGSLIGGGLGLLVGWVAMDRFVNGYE